METKSREMYKVATANGYDYYEGVDINDGKTGKKFYCLVPQGQPAPAGGYYSPEYACKVKNAPNLFK